MMKMIRMIPPIILNIVDSPRLFFKGGVLEAPLYLAKLLILKFECDRFPA
jgi:hypothetical protein